MGEKKGKMGGEGQTERFWYHINTKEETRGILVKGQHLFLAGDLHVRLQYLATPQRAQILG